jgi:hypothetical protein
VRVDPVSLAVLDMGAGDGLIDWIKALHTNLLIEGRSGRSIIGWIGVGLLALAMIGVVLWWPQPGQWRAAVTADPRARGVRLDTPVFPNTSGGLRDPKNTSRFPGRTGPSRFRLGDVAQFQEDDGHATRSGGALTPGHR